MKREEFSEYIVSAVGQYLNNSSAYDSDPQIRVNPADLAIDMVNGSDLLKAIEYSDEAVEAAAGVEGDASESATDYQASRDPEFYPLRSLIAVRPDGTREVDHKAVEALVGNYFR